MGGMVLVPLPLMGVFFLFMLCRQGNPIITLSLPIPQLLLLMMDFRAS